MSHTAIPCASQYIFFVITHFPLFSEWSSLKSNFRHKKSNFRHLEFFVLSKNILGSNKTYCFYLFFVFVWNLQKMRIDDFSENTDGRNWTFRGGNLTWGNSELNMGENGRSPWKVSFVYPLFCKSSMKKSVFRKIVIYVNIARRLLQPKRISLDT